MSLPQQEQRQPSLTHLVKTKLSDQDFLQKMNMILIFVFELYRVSVGTLLVIFVPQECATGDMCTVFESVQRTDTVAVAGLGINAITLFTFLILYTIEIRRENKLITYLQTNPNVPSDNSSVGQAIDRLTDTRKVAILRLDKQDQLAGYSTLIMFSVNSLLSAYVVFVHYLDEKTVTGFLTSMLFITMKLFDVYTIAHTPKNIFLSAYMRQKVQFNDVDPDKISISQ